MNNSEVQFSPFVLSLPLRGEKHFPILDSSRSAKMKSALVILQPGESVGSHNTGKREEQLVILDGVGEVEADGFGKQKVEKNYVVYIPADNQHNVKNIGTVPLRYIYTVSPIE